MAGSSEARERDSVLAGLDLIREIHSDLSLVDISVLLLVAEQPGISRSELALQLNISTETASRSLRTFAGPEFKNALHPALGLIEIVTSPDDGLTRRAYLTADGTAVVRKLNAFIAEGVQI